MPSRYIFSSESVGEGHPDKVSDTISDAILDACLAQDKNSRVACETMVKSNMVVVAGEITTNARFDYNAIIRQAIREIGYVHDDDIFHADRVFITNLLTAQSADIAQGVDARKAKGKKTAEQGAGDQGLMFGYACDETPELMPAPIMFAHRLGRELTRLRKSGKVGWLRPDAKSQVSVVYEDEKPVAISNVVISTQHAADVAHKEIESFLIEKVIKAVLPKELITKRTEFLINPTGRFVIGGPQGDSGLTGRKIIVDTYGRIPAKWTAVRLIWAAMLQRILWLRVLRRVARCNSPMPSGTRSRSVSISTPLARMRLMKQKSRRRFLRYSASSLRILFPICGFCARSIRRPPTTVTSEKMTAI